MANEKKKLVRITTPRGIAKYPKLNTPDTKFNADGVYSIKLIVPQAAAEKLIEQIDAAHAEAKALPEVQEAIAKKKKPKEGVLPYEVDSEKDEVTFSFKMKASGKTKAGEVFTRKPAIFDAKGNATGVTVGGGSTVRVTAELVPYYTGIAGYGVSMRLCAVQVIELRQYQAASADSYGFAAEEGFDSTGEDGEGTKEEKASTEGSDETPAATGSDF